MVNYTCPRCGFTTNIKTKYTSHLKRKYICKNIISDDNLYNEYIKYEIKEKLLNKLNVSQMSVKSKSNVSQMSVKSKSNVSKILDKKLYDCIYCNKSYNHRQSLHKHLKSCEEKKKDEEEKQNLLNLIELLNKQLEEQRESLNKQLEEQKKEKEEYKKQINELIKKTGINIGTQNNIHNTINILAYNNTDLSHLTDKDYLKCLKHSNFCIPQLIERIHFNPQKPENHNIYISNLKNNYVMIYNGSKWMINDRDESIQCLIDDKESIIEQKLEEWIENGNKYPDIMKKFNRYIEKKENDKVLNKIKSEIKMMLFNNRDVVSKNN